MISVSFGQKTLIVATACFLLFLGTAAAVLADNADVSVKVIIAECSDGVDNDIDGFVDYPNDPDCDSASDDSEEFFAPPEPPSPTAEPITSESSSRSGSGGVQQISKAEKPKTEISFSGLSYPVSQVFILKNGFTYLSTQSDESGNFFAEDRKAVAGSYTFSIRAYDKSGRESPPVSFSVIVPQGGSVFVDDIVIPPTIALSSSFISESSPVTVSGEAIANAFIEVGIFDKRFSTRANSSGAYRVLASPALPDGSYVVKTKAVIGDGVERFSAALSINIGQTNTFESLSRLTAGDLDGNGRVNLVDFSILAFWYRKNNAPASVDINKDGVVDLQDMSILAYNWNG